MKIGDYIKKIIKENGKTLKWVAQELNMNYKTFVGKLTRDTLTAKELLNIRKLLDIDLNSMVDEIEMGREDKFVFVAEDLYEEDINSLSTINVRKVEIVEDRNKNNNTIEIYVFEDFKDKDGNILYKIKKIYVKSLKPYKYILDWKMNRIKDGENIFKLMSPKAIILGNLENGMVIAHGKNRW